MSSTSGEEVPIEVATQEDRELNLVSRFDFYIVQNGLQRGAAILRFLGFGVVRLVGIDPDAARVGDIAVEIVHSGFYTRAIIWLKVTNGARAWAYTQNCRRTSSTLPTLRRVAPAFSERQSAIPRLGDIWVLKFAISPNHFVRLFIPGIEDLFQEGD
jgi:hypothetical protein